MTRKQPLVLSVLLCAALLAACAQAPAPGSVSLPPSESAAEPAPAPPVSLIIPERVYHFGETIRVTLKNEGETAISYGLPYTLEALRDGDWVELKWAEGKERVWILIAYLLGPGEEAALEFTVEQDEFDPVLEPGVYRLVKQVSAESPASGGEESGGLTLTAEFILAQADEASAQTPSASAASAGAAGVLKPDPTKVVLAPVQRVYSQDDEKIEIAMTNNDSMDYSIGPTYELEVWDGTQWIELERKESMQRNWNHEPGLIQAGETHAPAMGFSFQEYDDLAPGRYRAVTHGFAGVYGEVEVPEAVYVFSAEFTIE